MPRRLHLALTAQGELVLDPRDGGHAYRLRPCGHGAHDVVLRRWDREGTPLLESTLSTDLPAYLAILHAARHESRVYGREQPVFIAVRVAGRLWVLEPTSLPAHLEGYY
jgi:hypothetical protein